MKGYTKFRLLSILVLSGFILSAPTAVIAGNHSDKDSHKSDKKEDKKDSHKSDKKSDKKSGNKTDKIYQDSGGLTGAEGVIFY